jgi:hypothetical protein
MSAGEGKDAESAIVDYVENNPPQRDYSLGNVKPADIEKYFEGVEEGRYYANITLFSPKENVVWTIDVQEENGRWKAQRFQ